MSKYNPNNPKHIKVVDELPILPSIHREINALNTVIKRQTESIQCISESLEKREVLYDLNQVDSFLDALEEELFIMHLMSKEIDRRINPLRKILK